MKILLLGAAALTLAACNKGPETSLAGRWDVQEIAGAALGEGAEVWIAFDDAGDGVHGSTGCNTFTTRVTSFETALSFAPVQEQAGECASMAAATDEARFLGVLPSVRRYIRRGRSLELLPAANGSEALIRLRVKEEAS